MAYLKERKQFGKMIGEFQALQHRAAHLYSEIEITRAAVLKALQTLDGDFDHAGAIVAVAKARAGATANLAVQEGVQMHGGIGMTDEFDIGFFMKRVRVCQELFGDANFHADQARADEQILAAAIPARAQNAPHTPVSSPAKAGDPVRRGVSVSDLGLWNTDRPPLRAMTVVGADRAYLIGGAY